MAYKKSYLRYRVQAVQEFDRMYYEKENHSKCHRKAWERGRRIFGISYETYLDYLKWDVSDLPPMPPEAQDELRKMAEKSDRAR